MTDTAQTDPAPEGKPLWLRLLPLGLIALALATFLGLGGGEYLSLDAIRTHKDALAGFVADNLVLSLIAFAALYAVLTAISVPGASVLSLLGGFLFGTWFGGAAIVIGATLGATALFLAAKTAIGDTLRKRTSGKMIAKFEDGLRENELSYLFILRLIPVFPFFVVNFVPALFGVKLRNYVIATFFGIMPGSFVYASIGNGLEAILAGDDSSLSGAMLQPAVILPILGLIVLSLVPVLYKRFKGTPA